MNYLHKLVFCTTQKNSIPFYNLSRRIHQFINELIGKCQFISSQVLLNVHWQYTFWIFVIAEFTFKAWKLDFFVFLWNKCDIVLCLAIYKLAFLAESVLAFGCDLLVPKVRKCLSLPSLYFELHTWGFTEIFYGGTVPCCWRVASSISRSSSFKWIRIRAKVSHCFSLSSIKSYQLAWF